MPALVDVFSGDFSLPTAPQRSVSFFFCSRFTPPAFAQNSLKKLPFLRKKTSPRDVTKPGSPPTRKKSPVSWEITKKNRTRAPVDRRPGRYTDDCSVQLLPDSQAYSKAPPTTAGNYSRPISCGRVRDATPSTSRQPISALMAVLIDAKFKVC